MMLPMRARMLHAGNRLLSRPYGSFGECINSVDRRKLNELLLDEAQRLPNVRLFFLHDLDSAQLDTGDLIFTNKYVLIIVTWH